MDAHVTEAKATRHREFWSTSAAAVVVALLAFVGPFKDAEWARWVGYGALACGLIAAGLASYWHLRANKAASLSAEQEASARALAGALAEEERRAARAQWVRIPVGRISELPPEAPLHLGVDAAAQDFLSGGRVPAYVPRDKDVELRSAIHAAMTDRAAPWFILIHGHSKTGKSRTAYEALRATEPAKSALLVAPNSPVSLRHMLEDDEPIDQGSSSVLWLDDVEEYLFDHPLDIAALYRWRNGGEGRLVIGALGGKGREKSEYKANRETIDLLSTIRNDPATIEISLDRTTDLELDAIELAEGLRNAIGPYGLAAYLVAGPLLEIKMRDQRARHFDRKSPEGVALVEAAADWARCGRVDPISRDDLRGLWPAYRREPDRIFDPDDFDRAIEWACTPVDGETKLLIRDADTDSFRAFDYAVHLIDTILRVDIEPTPAAWRLALESVSMETVMAVESAAYARSDFNRAIEICDQIVRRFGNDPGPETRTQVARVLNNKGLALAQLERSRDEIAVYDEVIERFGDDPAPELHAPLASALVGKGVALGGLGRSEDAIVLYGEVVERFGDDPAPELRDSVAMALAGKGVALGGLGRSEDAIVLYGEVVERFGDDPASKLRVPVALALVSKGAALGRLERSEDAIELYGEVIKRFGDYSDPWLRVQVAQAFVSKGGALGGLGRLEDAIVAYGGVVERFGDDPAPELRARVAAAFVSKALALAQLERSEDAIVVCDEAVEWFGDDSTPENQIRVALTLVNKGLALAQLERSEEAIVVYDEVVERFGDDSASKLRLPVALALIVKGGALEGLGRLEDAIVAYGGVVERFGDDPAPKLRVQVAEALSQKRKLEQRRHLDKQDS